MKCITSPALDNVEIAMYVDGEAEEAVVAHINECPYCRERARQWTRLQTRLKQRSYRVNCPTPMELGEYHLGYLAAPQALVVSAHLRGCLLCQGEVTVLENFLTGIGPEISLLGAVKVLIARLIDAQAETGLAPALRGEAKGPLTFEANGVVIVLDIQPSSEDIVSIFGQVAADDQDQWTGALVELQQGSQLHFSTTVDDLGAFRCEGIRTGEQELRIITKDNSRVVISNFTAVI